MSNITLGQTLTHFQDQLCVAQTLFLNRSGINFMLVNLTCIVNLYIYVEFELENKSYTEARTLISLFLVWVASGQSWSHPQTSWGRSSQSRFSTLAHYPVHSWGSPPHFPVHSRGSPPWLTTPFTVGFLHLGLLCSQSGFLHLDSLRSQSGLST